jgi:hypothetical protein
MRSRVVALTVTRLVIFRIAEILGLAFIALRAGNAFRRAIAFAGLRVAFRRLLMTFTFLKDTCINAIH